MHIEVLYAAVQYLTLLMTDCCFAQYLSGRVYELGAQDTNVWMAQAAEISSSGR